MFDIAIIGAGPAGLSAAIYAGRKKLKTLVLAKSVGGQGTEAYLVENYLGIPAILGADLAEKFYGHVKKFEIEIKEGVLVEEIREAGEDFETVTAKEKFNSKTIIVATGKKYRELEIPGAKEYDGKGLTYCATCDAPIFKNKIVAVVGAGDAGLDAAWQLAGYATKIYLVNKYPDLRGNNKELEEKIKKNDRIEILNEYWPTEIKGDKFVQGLTIGKTGQTETRQLAVQGIFVEIGSVPSSKFLDGLVELNEKGEVVIDPKTNETTHRGIFAAGDVTDIKYKQMIVAAGEGAKAALSAYEYLKNNR